MTPLPEPPPPAGQLSEAWAEKMARAWLAKYGTFTLCPDDIQAARASWEASPARALIEALEKIAFNQVGKPVGAGDGGTYVITGHEWIEFREIARLALSSLGGSET